jgi:Family of unknown function (DUF6069)
MPHDPRDSRPERSGNRPYPYDQPGYDQPGYGPPGYDQPGYGPPGYDPRGPGRPPASRPTVAAGALWAGGVATAVVAALVALVGVLVSRWLAGIPLLAPMRAGAYGDVHTTSLVLLVAAAALVATGVLHLLLLSTPRPTLFFGWIIGLATVLAVVLPFTTSAPLASKAATAVVFLILGVAIGTLLTGVGARSIRPATGNYVAPAPGYDGSDQRSRYR